MADVHECRVQWSIFDAQTLSDLSRLAAFLGPSDFPAYFRAAETIAANAETLYRGYLLGEPTPAGKALARPSGSTAKGVTRDHTGLLAWTIKNNTPAAKAIEEGTEEYDQKKTLFNRTSKRARKAKDGSLYLVIAFRQGVPGTRGLNAMPKEVYRLAKKMEFSRVIGAPSTRTSATGWTVPRWSYRWNGALPDAKKLEGMGIDAGVAKKMAGMVRMAKGGHTSYVTFRVMSEKSPARSWIRPAVPALWPLRWAVDKALQDGEGMLLDAVQSDLWQALGLATVGI